LTAKVEAAFAKLEAAMRYMKDRYFKKPPLTDEGFVAPGLVPRDTKPTPAAKPESHVLLVPHYKGFDTAMIELSVMPGDPEVDEDCRIEIGRRTGQPVLNGFPIRAPKRSPSGLPRSAGSLWNSRRLATGRRDTGTGRGAKALPYESAGFRQGA
jgi:hypothetical protein